MRKLILSIVGAAFVGLMLVATAAAAGPNGSGAGQGSVVPSILGLTQAQVRELRQDGLSLAQIAERQKVDPQKLVDALAARWTERIDARVTAGALSTSEATQLKSQVELRAKDMVNRATSGGMGGVAVGAGNGRMGGGSGSGSCDGTGPHGAGRP